jgi:hypothetical protein
VSGTSEKVSHNGHVEPADDDPQVVADEAALLCDDLSAAVLDLDPQGARDFLPRLLACRDEVAALLALVQEARPRPEPVPATARHGLSAEEVQEARLLRERGASLREVARRFKLSRPAIRRLTSEVVPVAPTNGEAIRPWTPGPLDQQAGAGGRKSISREERAEIKAEMKAAVAQGEPRVTVGEKHNLTRDQVSYVLRED